MVRIGDDQKWGQYYIQKSSFPSYCSYLVTSPFKRKYRFNSVLNCLLGGIYNSMLVYQ